MEQWLGGGPGGAKRIQTFRWLLLIGLIGAGLMIMNSFIEVKKIDPISTSRASPDPSDAKQTLGSASKDKSPFREYEQAYETQLRDILQKIVGVGEVEVMVQIDSTEETVVEKNTKETQQSTNEQDKEGANRRVTDVTRSGEVVLYEVSGSQTPVIVKSIKPKIRGVLIVARGAENLTVKKLLVEAVERGLDVPSNRISVAPRKQ
ncbi:stage III sporulation protein AG [Paenibacillus aurantius]|uniref:Stage III sporulation protein AG n=1 Tax=Paenibacillus aurantius TaxID=2918900 RepID=A0AA96LA77_9BACL|nr:stage III sporulation protein AG [Paenibacillus aurantius]WNQ09398.1 stage III sporulation protein AG [Paenibacillus aurantius]